MVNYNQRKTQFLQYVQVIVDYKFQMKTKMQGSSTISSTVFFFGLKLILLSLLKKTFFSDYEHMSRNDMSGETIQRDSLTQR